MRGIGEAKDLKRSDFEFREVQGRQVVVYKRSRKSKTYLGDLKSKGPPPDVIIEKNLLVPFLCVHDMLRCEDQQRLCISEVDEGE